MKSPLTAHVAWTLALLLMLAGCGGGATTPNATGSGGTGGAGGGSTLKISVTDAPFPASFVESATVVINEVRIRDKDADAWVAELRRQGVPAGPINFADEALGSEQTRARAMIVELEHPLVGLVRSLACPVHAAGRGPTYRRYPPRLGEHGDEIRAEVAARG